MTSDNVNIYLKNLFRVFEWTSSNSMFVTVQKSRHSGDVTTSVFGYIFLNGTVPIQNPNCSIVFIRYVAASWHIVVHRGWGQMNLFYFGFEEWFMVFMFFTVRALVQFC